jgi:hypothetical protein
MTVDVITSALNSAPEEAWADIFAELWLIFSPPVPRPDLVDAETLRRDRQSSALDNLLSGSGWDLWKSFSTATPRTSEQLKTFWAGRQNQKAILILDALSLRELPWLLEEAEHRGFTLHKKTITAAELPGNTTPFARALGFGQRSSLDNNQGTSAHFPSAWTNYSDLPFAEAAKLIAPEPNIVFWHDWPDGQMHHLSGGNEYATLAKAARDTLTSDEFWALVEKLCTGRRLVITADHGYSHCGLFPDITHKDQLNYLKQTFGAKRGVKLTDAEKQHHWVPPLSLRFETPSGLQELALGRRKWKVSGGYPTLAHGGLTLLEMAVPYLELSK